jgi:hypothetical protein
MWQLPELSQQPLHVEGQSLLEVPPPEPPPVLPPTHMPVLESHV